MPTLDPSPRSEPPWCGPDLPQDVLYLREGFLDGVQVRRVGWQVDELASPLFYEIPHPPWPVRSEIVHHHDLPWLEGRRSQQALHLRLEHSSIARSLQGHRRSHPRSMLVSSVVFLPRFVGISKI